MYRISRLATKTVISLLLIWLVVSALPLHITSVHAASTPSRHLGFWTGEADLWSGGAITGTNPSYTPQQFFSVYFNQIPYPSAMLFATSLSPTGPYAGNIYNGVGGWQGEADWLNAFLALCDSHPNIKIIILAFVNLSGGSISGTPDQTVAFTTFMNMIKGHPSVFAVEYENEYFGDTLQEEQTFKTIVNNAGYVDVHNPTSLGSNYFPTEPVLGYSTYPYFGGKIPTSLIAGYVGYGYGETGAPCSGCSNPIWTQQTVQSIVQSSPSASFTLIYAQMGGNGQPFSSLWNWPTFRSWIWNAPGYQSNYVLSTSSASSTSSSASSSTSMTSVNTVTSTTSATTRSSQNELASSTSSSATLSDPPLSISISNPSVGSWVKISGSGFPTSRSLEVTVSNNNANSYVAYLYPGSTSSSGTFSFWMQITSAMAGEDTLFVYSPAGASTSNYQAGLQFTAS